MSNRLLAILTLVTALGLGTTALRDGVGARKPAGEIVDYLPAKPRNTDARLTCTRAVPTTTTRMRLGGSSYVDQSSRLTVA
jgi:hypothetical protein